MPEEQELPTKTRRRWKRWVLGLFVLVVIFVFWLNGPGIRSITKSQIEKQLATQNLKGSFEIEGTMLHGLSLKNVDLTGENQIRRVEIKEATLVWSPSSLFEQQLEKIEVSDLKLQLDLDREKIPPEEDPSPEKPLSETLGLVRGIIGETQTKFTNIEVDVTATGKNFALNLESLTHEPQSDVWEFQNLTLKDHLGHVTTNERSLLTWTDSEFQLDRIDLLPGLGLRETVFEFEQSVSGTVLLADSEFAVSSNLEKEFELTLKSPTFQPEKLAAIWDPSINVGANITILSLTPERLILKGTDLRWEEHTIDSVDLNGTLTGKKTKVDLKAIYQNQAISLTASGKDGLEVLERELDVVLNYQDQVTAKGTVIPGKDLATTSAQLSYLVTYPKVPEINGDLTLEQEVVKTQGRLLEGLIFDVVYDIKKSTYTATLEGKTTRSNEVHETLTGPLQLKAVASGNLEQATHIGDLQLSTLTLAEPRLKAQGTAKWNWPEKINVPRLRLQSEQGEVVTKFSWKNDFLKVDSLKLIEAGREVLTAQGTLPAPLDTTSLDGILASTRPIDFRLKSQPLSFGRLREFAPIPRNLRGVFQADLALTGSLAKPQLNGEASLTGFSQDDQPKIPPADIRTTFRTEKQNLFINGSAREPGGPLLNLDGKIAFLPKVWLKQKESPKNAAIDFRVTSERLDLKRLKPFAPMIRLVDGFAETKLRVSGTLAKPSYFGEVSLGIKRMLLADSPVADLRDSRLRITFENDTVTIHPSTFVAAGGTLKLNGQVKLDGDEPVFDLALSGHHTLLARTEDFSFRGHPNLTLRGPLSKAKLSGTLAIAESLIYKDVEILPFGVPSTTEIPRPNLPTFVSKTRAQQTADIPEPFASWPLDIAVSTADLVLIRGNLARGALSAKAKIGGTIGDPRPSGTITSEKLSADLPFSNLVVNSAVVTLRPSDYTNPLINLRGTSEVASYTVQVFLSGPVQNPTLTLSSNPPLPENEIMLLLATGSPSASLEDRQVASQKALQYLLEGLRRRYGDDDKTVFHQLLKNTEDIQLSLGDTNRFNGRRFSSATLEINDRWDFTTQIDEQGQTRALVVFSLRFR